MTRRYVKPRQVEVRKPPRRIYFTRREFIRDEFVRPQNCKHAASTNNPKKFACSALERECKTYGYHFCTHYERDPRKARNRRRYLPRSFYDGPMGTPFGE